MFGRRFDYMLLRSNVAYLGVLLSLNQLFIILSSLIKTNTVIFMSAAALVVGVIIVEFRGKVGIAFYLASVFLGLILTFDKVEIITYICFFGLYSIVKHYIEINIFNKYISYGVKLFFFNISLLSIYLIVRLFVPLNLFWWMILGAQILFFLYDYAFTIFINYYIETIRPKLKR